MIWDTSQPEGTVARGSSNGTRAPFVSLLNDGPAVETMKKRITDLDDLDRRSDRVGDREPLAARVGGGDGEGEREPTGLLDRDDERGGDLHVRGHAAHCPRR